MRKKYGYVGIKIRGSHYNPYNESNIIYKDAKEIVIGLTVYSKFCDKYFFAFKFIKSTCANEKSKLIIYEQKRTTERRYETIKRTEILINFEIEIPYIKEMYKVNQCGEYNNILFEEYYLTDNNKIIINKDYVYSLAKRIGNAMYIYQYDQKKMEL